MSAGDGDTARFVDVKVHDRSGRMVFASPDTEPGPHGVEVNLLSNSNVDLRVSTSMTPGFIAMLGPEHGAGPGRELVIGLVAVNVLLVTIGIWQLARERELTRVRANFVAGVSHELRTPLAQIRMFAETLMLDRIRSPDEGKRAVDIIGRETRRLSQLVDNVLYFHRHDRVPALDAAEVVDLVPLIRDVVDGFAPLAAAQRVQITFAPVVDELLVRANPDGVRQVLLNLLDNAVKFGPAGQTVSVTVDAAADDVHMTIEDQGPGIQVSERKRIFNAFERGRNTRGAGGAGIGLAVVRQIVDAHGGHVIIESAPSGGARFTVSLPTGAGRHGSVGRPGSQGRQPQ
jgi:signal transduction histidine kinase